MAGSGDSPGREVVLGMDAAWGFSSADPTSPAKAAGAKALMDVSMAGPSVTELRIHGVSGSDGPTMLEHPAALQVAGDGITGFYRRWNPDGPGRPSVPWRLEAYSWGGLTEQPLAAALWLLLAPFMFYNLAFFALPPAGPDGGNVRPARGAVDYLRRGRGHALAAVLLRLLALAATVQFVTAVVTLTVSTVAWQAAGRAALLPDWMGWYGEWTAGWRVALALAAVAAVVAGLWAASALTAHHYETRTSRAESQLNARWPLTQPGFWRGKTLVTRQRAVHSAAACAAAALAASWPAAQSGTVGWAAVGVASAVLAATVLSTAMPFADRHEVTMIRGGEPGRRAARWWCGVLLASGAAALVLAAVVSGVADQRHGPQPGALPGSAGLLAWLLAGQAVLLAVLAVVVAVLAGQARRADSLGEARPYLGGSLAPLFALLGVLAGGLLTAVVNFGITRLVGTPVPSGFDFRPQPADALAVPWPVYAFGLGTAGLLAGAVAAAVLLAVRFWRRVRRYQSAEPGAGPSMVSRAYRETTAGPPGQDRDGRAYARHRRAIAMAWAVGDIADDAAIAMALVAGLTGAVVLAAEIAAALRAGPAGHPWELPPAWHGLASAIAVLGVLAAGGLVTLLRQAYSDPAKRKTIGILWDVGTFWPRAVHPLAPPCYAERAIPEVVDRIRLLTGHTGLQPDDIARLHAEAGRPDLARAPGLTVPAGPVLLTGYSQGAAIAPAVMAQLPAQVRASVALLTLACPARRLYGRAFPAYFGAPQLAELRGMLGAEPGQPAGRWKNLRRRSDYIGSWVFSEPAPPGPGTPDQDQVDQYAQDPVILVPDANPTPPPTHRHLQWWQDPRAGYLAASLVAQLGRGIKPPPSSPPPDSRPRPPEPPPAWPGPGYEAGRARDAAGGPAAPKRSWPGRGGRAVAAGSAVVAGAAGGAAVALEGVSVAISAAVGFGVAGAGLGAFQLFTVAGTRRASRRAGAAAQAWPGEPAEADAAAWDEAVRETPAGAGPAGPAEAASGAPAGGSGAGAAGGAAPAGPGAAGAVANPVATAFSADHADWLRDAVPGQAAASDSASRYLLGRFPGRVRPRQAFSILVSVIRPAGAPPAAAALLKAVPIPAGGRLFTLVIDAPRLRVLDDFRQRVLVPPGRDSELVKFDVVADDPGPCRVSVTAWDGGSYLGELALDVSVEQDAPPGPDRTVVSLAREEGTAGEVTLKVRYNRSQQAYRFEFIDVDYPDEVTGQLDYDPGPAVRRLLRSLNDMAQGSAARSAATSRLSLMNEGVELWEQLIPDQLKSQFWERQKRISQLRILSDQDVVPWELLYPRGRRLDAGFLVEQFPVTRAIYGRAQARRLRLQPARFVVPPGSPPDARAEVKALAALLETRLSTVSELLPLIRLIEGGRFGLLHFACHNSFDPDDGSSIMLNEQFTPTLLATAASARTLAQAGPLVFINACRSLGAVPSYNKLDGWADKFLRAGAAAFIGSLWEVSDGAAREFAQELYRRLISGDRLGPAVMAARTAIAEESGDPTWLAYAVYGDPQASVQPPA